MLRATDATLSVKGDIGTDLKQQGRLDYQLRVKTLSPWLALMDRQGSGAINVTGGAKGNLNEQGQGKNSLERDNRGPLCRAVPSITIWVI
jgi:hypothetical protein